MTTKMEHIFCSGCVKKILKLLYLYFISKLLFNIICVSSLKFLTKVKSVIFPEGRHLTGPL